MRIFISYAKKDTRALAQQLRDALNTLPDVAAWMDESIQVGGNWPQEIQNEVDDSNLMIVLISPDANRKTHPPSFVVNEFQRALRKGKRIVPVLAHPTDIPIALEVYHYIDLTQNPADGVAAVVAEVCKLTGIRPPAPVVPPRESTPHLPPAPTAAPPADSPSPLARPRARAILPPPFEWIEIPAGKVTLEAGGYLESETVFDVPAFLIAKYPITNAQYARFIAAGGYRERKWWTESGWQQREKDGWTEPRYWQDREWNGADYPVVGVSWYEAVAFCQWLSAATGENVTLPTEQQWQRAAQGDDGRTYPWGNEPPNEQLCNWRGANIGHTTPVTRYPKGAGPYGVMDLSGNVWEWCLTGYESGSLSLDGMGADTRRVGRGGSWGFDQNDARAASRDRLKTVSRSFYVGFRVVRVPHL
jgi:formylglycine-generating enzyme required for sulfatase activity